MDRKLTEILGRLVAQRDGSALTDDDYAYVSRLVAARAPRAEGDARPLWYWVRERAAAWDFAWFELASAMELSEYADPILADAGAPGVYGTSPARWTAPVSREGLHRAVRRHLAGEQSDGEGPHTVAALLVGLAGFDDLAPLLVAGLAAVRAGRRTWWDDAVANALRSLAMLDHPSMRELAPLYAHHATQVFRAPVRGWAARHAAKLDDRELVAAVGPARDGEWLTWVELVGCYPEVARRVADAGVDLAKALGDALGEGAPGMFRASLGLAQLVVGGGWKDLFARWLASYSADLRGALALAACWSGAKWAREPVRARLEGTEEDDDGVLACLAAAALTLEKNPDRHLDEALASGNTGRSLGGVWASLGRDDVHARLLPLLQDEGGAVAVAAAAALVASAPSPAPEALDVVFGKVIQSDAVWARWLAFRALEVRGVATPAVVRDYVLGNTLRGPDEYDEARAFYAGHRHLLFGWAGDDWLGTLQSQLFPEATEISLEADLVGATSLADATRIWQELVCAGGPRTPSGRLRGALLAGPQDRRVELDDETFPAAVTIAAMESEPLRDRAIAALGSAGARAEPVLATVLHCVRDESAVQPAIKATLELDDASDPLLVEVRALLHEPERPLAELRSLPWLDQRLDGASRARLAERLREPSTPLDVALPLLTDLVNDESQDTAMAAFASLHERVGDAPWLQSLVALRSYDGNWQLRRQATEMLGRVGGEAALPRLLALLGDGDNDVVNAAVEGLSTLAARNPALGLAVLDIRDPDRVKTRYALSEEVDWSQDARAEALRLLLVGLDGRKDAALAKRHRGRKVVVTRVKADADQGHAPLARPLATDEFESLALYLRVEFADDETGSIVAEVAKDASGEVLSALLQTDSTVVATAAWS